MEIGERNSDELRYHGIIGAAAPLRYEISLCVNCSARCSR